MTTIRCRDAAELVCDARDRTLGADESAALQKHLQGCERCQSAAQQFQELFSQLDELLARPVDEAVNL